VLLVEDIEDNRVLITLFLKALSCRLDLAEHGAEGVNTFQAGRYDLVLMDIQMPIMDGYAATRAIRAWETTEGREATPIIALTASAFEEDIEKARAAGVTMRILPGIMPVTNVKQVARMAQLSGADFPAWLEDRLSDAGDDLDAMYAIGIEEAVRLCEALLAAGAPGLHFYTLNRSSATRDIYASLGLGAGS